MIPAPHPAKADIPCHLCWVTGCSRHSWHWTMKHHLVTWPWEESSNGHILCILCFLSNHPARNLEEMECLRENEGRHWDSGDTGFLPAWSFTFVPMSNKGMKTMGLSCIWASKRSCLWLASLHLNRKKFRVSHLKCRAKYINAASKRT